MKELIKIDSEEIRLCSNLNEYSFGKTNYESVISQEGKIFIFKEKKSDEKNDEKTSFENDSCENVFLPWSFSDVKSFYEESSSKTFSDSNESKNNRSYDEESSNDSNYIEEKNKNTKNAERIVFYCGKNPFSSDAKPLSTFFEQTENDFHKSNLKNESSSASEKTSEKETSEKETSEKETSEKETSEKDISIEKNDGNHKKLFAAAKAVCKALTVAAETGEKIPAVGAGGIIVDVQNDSTKVLFLPEELFKNSANGLSKQEFRNLHLGWINQTIYDLPAICFERAVIAYRLLCRKFPYENFDAVERNADILDSKFLPVQMCIKGLDKKLSESINSGLKLNSNVVNIPGKKQKGKSSEQLTINPSFPLELLENGFELSLEQQKNPPEKEFFEKAENYLKNQNSKIKTKRNLRRNSATIVVILIVAAIFASLIWNSISTGKKSETSIGLTAEQTILGYFYGVNSKDTVLLTNFVKGKNPQKHVDTVSQIYVLDKQRHIYEKDNGFASPENWLIFSNTLEKYQNSGIFGVTNLQIDGSPMEIDVKIPLKKDNPSPLTIQDGKEVFDKMKDVHNVQYYHIHSEGENNQFIVEKVFEEFTLTFEKNRWLITNISTDSVTVPVSSMTFKNDYMNQLAMNDGDVIISVENLREKYPWLPSKTSLIKEQNRLAEIAANPFSMLQ